VLIDGDNVYLSCYVGCAKRVEHLVSNQLPDACFRTALNNQRL